MELKAKLNKPYTDGAKMAFYADNVQVNGYKLIETKKALEAWGYTEEEKAEQERERIGNLQVTKRVFMLGLQELGITYTQLKELLATNEQAQMEWDLCVELQRKNPLLDVMASQMSVSSKMLDYIFRKANGEDVPTPNIEVD